jgi:UDP-glucuronate decarboxylase
MNNLILTINNDAKSIAQKKLPWEKLEGKKVLVSGATGFIGNYIVRTLIALNNVRFISNPIKILVMVRNLKRANIFFNDLLDKSHIKIIEWDLKCFGVPNIMDAEYVIHAASNASPRFYGTDPVGTILPNALGTASLLESMRRTKCAKGFLFISSSEVYGLVENNLKLSENSFGIVNPATIRACYAESKRIGETICLAFEKQYGIPAYIIRPFHTYGPGLSPKDGRVFSDFAFNVINNEEILMKSNGKDRRSFCYIVDLVTGLFTVLLKGNSSEPYNVANPDGVLSITELANLLINIFPEKKIVIKKRINLNKKGYIKSKYEELIPNVDKLTKLGWVAEVDPKSGFYKMINAYN